MNYPVKIRVVKMSLLKFLLNLSKLYWMDLEEITTKTESKPDSIVKANIFGDKENSPECPTCFSLIDESFTCPHCGDLTPHEVN